MLPNGKGRARFICQSLNDAAGKNRLCALEMFAIHGLTCTAQTNGALRAQSSGCVEARDRFQDGKEPSEHEEKIGKELPSVADADL